MDVSLIDSIFIIIIIILSQVTPTDSTVSHAARSSRRAMAAGGSNRGNHRGTSEHTLPFRSSSSTALSQVPPPTTADCTLVDHDQGGVGGTKGAESKPLVLNSVYTNGLGWASQVNNYYLVRNSELSIIFLVILWRHLGAV